MQYTYVLIGVGIVTIVVLLYLSSINGDDLLPDFAACTLDTDCTSQTCCQIEGYNKAVCSPSKSQCLKKPGELCTCKEESRIGCASNCLPNLTCCETADGKVCSTDASACLPGIGEECPNKVCQSSLFCCKVEQGGPFVCTNDEEKCVGLDPETPCSKDDDCNKGFRCCVKKGEYGKTCTQEQDCQFDEGWSCSSTNECFSEFSCCRSEIDTETKCHKEPDCVSMDGESCASRPCKNGLKCCGSELICKADCGSLPCETNEQCMGLKCCGYTNKTCLETCRTVSCNEDANCQGMLCCGSKRCSPDCVGETCTSTDACKGKKCCNGKCSATDCKLHDTCTSEKDCGPNLICAPNGICSQVMTEGNPCFDGVYCAEGLTCCTHGSATTLDETWCLQPGDCRTIYNQPYSYERPCGQLGVACKEDGKCRRSKDSICTGRFVLIMSYTGRAFETGDLGQENSAALTGQTSFRNLSFDKSKKYWILTGEDGNQYRARKDTLNLHTAIFETAALRPIAATMVPFFVCTVYFPVNGLPYFHYSSENIYRNGKILRSGNVEIQPPKTEPYNSHNFISLYGEYNTPYYCMVKFNNRMQANCFVYVNENQYVYRLENGICPDYVDITQEYPNDPIDMKITFTFTEMIDPFDNV